MMAQWELGFARLVDFQVHGVQHRLTGRLVVTGISVCGTCARPTATFWESVRNNFPAAWVDADTADVAACFRRVQQQARRGVAWYCLHRDADGHVALIAIGAPASASRVRRHVLPLRSMRGRGRVAA